MSKRPPAPKADPLSFRLSGETEKHLTIVVDLDDRDAFNSLWRMGGRTVVSVCAIRDGKKCWSHLNLFTSDAHPCSGGMILTLSTVDRTRDRKRDLKARPWAPVTEDTDPRKEAGDV